MTEAQLLLEKSCANASFRLEAAKRFLAGHLAQSRPPAYRSNTRAASALPDHRVAGKRRNRGHGGAHEVRRVFPFREYTPRARPIHTYQRDLRCNRGGL